MLWLVGIYGETQENDKQWAERPPPRAGAPTQPARRVASLAIQQSRVRL